MLKLFTDTAANMPMRLVKQYGISVIPLSYSVDGVVMPYPDEEDFDGHTFYESMRAGAMVQTSMINPGLAEDYFEKAASVGDDVLYIGLSSGVSGCSQAAQIAAENLRERYPNVRFEVFDTYGASMGEGLFVLEAAELIEAGKSFDEVMEHLYARRDHMCQFFTVDDLEYLKRGGRVSAAVAMLGSMLGIKPILRGDATGHIEVLSKVRGSKKAFATLAENYKNLAFDKHERISIAHADNPEGLLQLLTMLHEAGFDGECITVDYEPVTGSHVGPGALALFFFGEHK